MTNRVLAADGVESMSVYERAGEIRTGSLEHPSEAELARQERIKREG